MKYVSIAMMVLMVSGMAMATTIQTKYVAKVGYVNSLGEMKKLASVRVFTQVNHEKNECLIQVGKKDMLSLWIEDGIETYQCIEMADQGRLFVSEDTIKSIFMRSWWMTPWISDAVGDRVQDIATDGKVAKRQQDTVSGLLSRLLGRLTGVRSIDMNRPSTFEMTETANDKLVFEITKKKETLVE